MPGILAFRMQRLLRPRADKGVYMRIATKAEAISSSFFVNFQGYKINHNPDALPDLTVNFRG
jgi:hypothetical protein